MENSQQPGYITSGIIIPEPTLLEMLKWKIQEVLGIDELEDRVEELENEINKLKREPIYKNVTGGSVYLASGRMELDQETADQIVKSIRG